MNTLGSSEDSKRQDTYLSQDMANIQKRVALKVRLFIALLHVQQL